MIGYDPEKDLLKNKIKLRSISPFNNEQGEGLINTLRSWVDIVHVKDELYQHVKFVLCAAFLNDYEVVKLALELFGYPICYKENIEIEDPYYRVYNNKEISKEIKDLLRDYILKENRIGLYSEEQKKKILLF